MSSQIKKIGSEYREVEEAYIEWQISEHKTDYAPFRVAEETLDVIHACETLLHMLEADGLDIEEVKDFVETKNRKRGYYESANNLRD